MDLIWNNKKTILGVSALLILVGVFFTAKMPLELYPNATQPRIYVYLNYEAISPDAFKDKYGSEIEGRLLSIPGFENVECLYQADAATCKVLLPYKIDKQKKLAEVISRLDPVFLSFPADWKKPAVNFGDSNNGVLIIALSSREYKPEYIYAKISSKIDEYVKSNRAISKGELSNYFEKKNRIVFDDAMLNKYKLSHGAVIKAVTAKTRTAGSLGTAELGGKALLVQDGDEKTDLTTLMSTVVGYNGAVAIMLRDVARSGIVPVQANEMFKTNGEYSLVLWISPDADANLNALTDEVLAKLNSILSEFNGKVTANVVLNPASFIETAISDVSISILIGVLVSALLVFLFVRAGKYVGVIVYSVPFSVFATLAVMYFLDLNVNIISLGALSIALGLVIDSAIVVAENIHKKGLSIASVAEVRSSLVASALCTVCVFVPMGLSQDMIAAVFKDVAIVMIINLVLSLFFALCVVPAALVVLGGPEAEGAAPAGPGRSGRFEKLAGCVNKFVLYRYAGTAFILLCAAGFAGSVYLLKYRVNRNFITNQQSNVIVFQRGSMNAPDSNEEQEADFRKTETEVRGLTEEYVDFEMTIIQRSKAMMLLRLKDVKDSETVKRLLGDKYKSDASYQYAAVDWIPTQFEIPNPPNLTVALSRNNGGDEKTRQEVEAAVSKLTGFDKLRWFPASSKNKRIVIAVDNDKLCRVCGRDCGDFSGSLGVLLSDQYAGEVSDQGRTFRTYLASGGLRDLDELKEKTFWVNNRSFRLGDVAVVEEKEFAGEIYSEDGVRAEKVAVYFKDPSRVDYAPVAKALKDVFGDRISVTNSYGVVERNIYSLLVSSAVSLLLIVAVALVFFRSVKYCLLTLSVIPLNFIVAIFSLYAFKSDLGINAILGVIVLTGISVNTTILFIDYYRKNRTENKLDSVMAALRNRVRPISMTTLCSVACLLPVALNVLPAAKPLQPLAIVICSGLAFSMLVKVFMLPWLLYRIK